MSGSRRSWLALPLALTITACGAMSERDFARLAHEVASRNEARSALASEAFEARGFRFVDDERLYVSIDEDTRRACRDGTSGVDDVGALPRATLRIAPATRAGTTPAEPIELYVWLTDACALFRDATDTVEGLGADGNPRRIARLNERHRLARDPEGALVAVDVALRTTSTRSVLVERHCDHTPSGGEDPMRRRIHVPVVFEAAPLRVVTLEVDHEVLEVRCTHNTY